MAGTNVKRASTNTGKTVEKSGKYPTLKDHLLALADQGRSGDEIEAATGVPAAQAMSMT